MSAFLVVAVLLTAAALLCVLPPLLHRAPQPADGRSPQQINLSILRTQMRELDADLQRGTLSPSAHRAALRELERRVAEEIQPGAAPLALPPQRLTALLLALALPAAAAALYFHVGRPAGAALAAAQRPAADQGHAAQPDDMNAAVQNLADRLRNEPEDAEGWQMLARSYSALERFREAAQAYSRLNSLMPDDPDVLADYADALASAEEGKLTGQPERLIARALAIAPRHVKALALSGSAAFARGDFASAVEQWQALLPSVPPDSPFAESTRASIVAAQARLHTAPPAAGKAAALPAAKPGATRPAAASTLSGTVRLAPGLQQKVAPDDTLFIYARAAEGPRQPLAALRLQASALPLDFALDDSHSMLPGRPLSGAARVIVTARISRSGNALPQAGDLEGSSAPVAPSAGGVQIEIRSPSSAASPPHN